MTPSEKTLNFLIEYAIEEGWRLWISLSKKEASRKLSKMICDLIAVNGLEIKDKGKGNLKNLNDLDDDTAATIASIDIVTKTDGESSICVVKIKFWDKNAALEKLAKHFSLYVDKVEHSVDDSLTRLLRELDGKTRLLPKLNR